jgi:hypothetical protein
MTSVIDISRRLDTHELDDFVSMTRASRSFLSQDTKEPGTESDYFLRAMGGPLTRLTIMSTVTSTRSAILIKGIPLFMP